MMNAIKKTALLVVVFLFTWVGQAHSVATVWQKEVYNICQVTAYDLNGQPQLLSGTLTWCQKAAWSVCWAAPCTVNSFE